MKLNFKVRAKNPYFWIGLLGVIFTAMGVSTETLTSWDAVLNSLITLINNPYMIISVVVAVLGIFIDPTTSGLGDSASALTYSSPKVSLTETTPIDELSETESETTTDEENE